MLRNILHLGNRTVSGARRGKVTDLHLAWHKHMHAWHQILAWMSFPNPDPGLEFTHGDRLPASVHSPGHQRPRNRISVPFMQCQWFAGG